MNQKLSKVKLVEDIEYLLPVKFRQTCMFRGCKEVENVWASQRPGQPSLFSDHLENIEIKVSKYQNHNCLYVDFTNGCLCVKKWFLHDKLHFLLKYCEWWYFTHTWHVLTMTRGGLLSSIEFGIKRSKSNTDFNIYGQKFKALKLLNGGFTIG